MLLRERIRLILTKRALHETSFVAAGSLINGGSLLLLNIVLARAVSQEQFGIFSLAVLALATAGEISDFGLNLGMLRFAPYYIATNQGDKLQQLLKTIWRWRVSLTTILTTVGIVCAYPLAKYVFGQPTISPYLLYSSFGVGGVILLGFLSTYLQSQRRFLYHASVQSLKGVARLLIVIALAVSGVTNLYAYLSAYILVPWVLFLINFGVFPKKFTQVNISPEVKKELHTQLARFSLWLTVSSLISIVAGKIDQVMISHLLGLEEVAIFAVAWQLVQIFPVIYGSITSVLMPRISSVVNKGDLLILVRRTTKWTAVGSIGIALLIYPSQYLIDFLFGEKYVTAMPVYLILAYSLLCNVISIPFSLTITAFNRTQIAALSGVVQLILLVGFNFILIPFYGIMGAAYTFLISNLCQLIWNVSWAVYLFKKKDLKKL